MEEIIDKLAITLEQIESYHGVIQDGSSHRYVRLLHQQARNYVAEIRQSIHELFQQATPIIQAMADSEMVYNDNNGLIECHYCSIFRQLITEPLQPQEHDEDCPIRLAAAWLEKWKKQQNKSGYDDIPVTLLKTGDIFCPPSGNPPGIITRIYRDPLTASNKYPLITFNYEGDVCGKRICDIRQDQVVRVYRGKLEDAETAWTTKYETKEL